MKKYLKGFLAAFAAFFVACGIQTVKADTTKDGAFEYKVDYYNESVTITKYCGSDAEVVIPDKIDGYKVEHIGEKAFYYNSAITSVKLPSALKTIEDNSFAECSNLADISFPDSLETINGRAFRNCDSLTKISLPACNINPYIGWSTYYGTFSFCDNLKSVTIKGGKDYVIETAFHDCTSLEKVKLGKGCTKIDVFTFSGCSNLEEISIPSTVTEIGREAFLDCMKLKAVNVKNVTSFGESAFSGCTSLSDVTFSSKYTYVGKSAFNGTKITSITVPKTCTYADFRGMPELKKLVLKSKDTDLHVSGCPKLRDLILPKNMESLIFLRGCNVKSYVVPACIGSIGEFNFEGNVNAKIYILNPDCRINDGALPRNSKTVIYGYKDSTAQEAAKNHGLKFKAITTVKSVKATNSAKGTAKITWKKVSGVEKYTIYRSTSENGTYEKIGTSKTTSYTDKKASKGTTYYYKISIDYTDKDGVKLTGVMSKPAKVQIKK